MYKNLEKKKKNALKWKKEHPERWKKIRNKASDDWKARNMDSFG